MSTEPTSEADIRRLLDSGADDDSICDTYDRLLTSLNGPTATVHRLAAASFILTRRPHLAERVLEFPVYGYLMHGNPWPDGIIRNGVAKSEEHWVQEIAGPDGVQWLREELPKLEGLLARLLWEAEVLARLRFYGELSPMSEADWRTCENACRIWDYIWRLRRMPHRKRVLAAAAVCRSGAHLFRDEAVLRAVVQGLEARAEPGFAGDSPGELPGVDGSLAESWPNLTDEESRVLAPLLRDIFGNPFRASHSLPQAVLAWNDMTVRRIAEGIYKDQAWSRSPILADALLDAGCEDEELLAHCRDSGPHIRGCWALDLILSKGC